VCGIFGIIDRNGLRANDPAILSNLAECLEHRGPDGGSGILTRKAAIGMQRLAIIDPVGGMQPLWNERRTVALVANGEIYNFVERRKELEHRGHRFATNSDCEVIIHLYEELGTGCLDQLRGMFAFALIDFEKGLVLIARDRLGEKPLFIAESGDRMVFASELGALIGAGIVPFQLNDTAIRDYFLWGYVPEPDSPVLGARKLPAASYIEISLDPWSVRERCWWSPSAAPEVQGDPRELLVETLADVGRLTVRADVPVGVALSGGVDSSAVAALACAHAARDVHTFTVGYEGSGHNDESDVAAAYASQLGTKHHRVVLEHLKVAKDFPRMCQARGEPISDASGSGYLALMEAAHAEGVPVLLFGHGADELSWGYPWSADAVRANLRKEALLAGRAGLGAYLRTRRPPRSYGGIVTWALAAGGLLSGYRDWQRDRSSPSGQMVFFDQQPSWRLAARNLERVATPGFLERVSTSRAERYCTFPTLPQRPDLKMTELFLSTYLLGNGIVQGDRLSMSASVESRLPLVDYRLVETVIGLRRNTEDWRLPPKTWLRDALSRTVPREVLERPKRGFTPPWREWTREIIHQHGGELPRGVLVEMGVLRPADAAPRPFDRFGRQAQGVMPALMLEMWARGMRDLEQARRSSRAVCAPAAWTQYAVPLPGPNDRNARSF
jgi:asparagine synthase (glutamine-hydrolysing)